MRLSGHCDIRWRERRAQRLRKQIRARKLRKQCRARSHKQHRAEILQIRHVAWLGGTYSPPTTAHFMVAMEIGKKMAERNPNEKCVVSITPVSHAYPKPSIHIDCVSPEARVALVKAMVKALNEENTYANLKFVLEYHELNSKVAVPTITSLSMLKQKYPNATVYISQGQDNVEKIFLRKWVDSDKLIENFGFIMYPRGDDDNNTLKDMDGPLANALKAPKEQSKEKAFDPYTEVRIHEILGRVHIIDTGFNDESSSTDLRKAIREKNLETIKSMFHPAVYAKFLELKELYPRMYQMIV
jgi:nicotinic acid mononucleotide adenylyltransferase